MVSEEVAFGNTAPVKEREAEEEGTRGEKAAGEKFKAKAALLILAVALMAVALAANAYLYFKPPACDEASAVNTSLSVVPAAPQQRTLIGLNADTDSLAFGQVSPGAQIERSILVRHAQDAEVLVSVQAPFAEWAQITPEGFFLPAAAEQKVLFRVTVPEDAAAADYEGIVRFCFKNV